MFLSLCARGQEEVGRRGGGGVIFSKKTGQLPQNLCSL